MYKLLALLCLLFPSLASTEPQIKQFFPDRPLQLGQPLFWIIELRHPMWESYELKFGACPDLKMSVEDKTLTDVAGEIRAVYRVAVVPTALKTSCTPSLTLSDESSQTSVLNGKRLTIYPISGQSQEIRYPALPAASTRSSYYYYFLFSLLAMLAVLCVIAIAKRIYSNTPTQRFLRDLRKASIEVRKDKLPIQVWRLLRSGMVWGFDAAAYTPAQLHQRASRNPRLLGIAATLQSLETWRYSGTSAQWDKDLVRQALAHAEAIVELRKPFRRRSAA